MAPIGDEDSIIIMLSNRIKKLEDNFEYLDKKVEFILTTQNKMQKELNERKE